MKIASNPFVTLMDPYTIHILKDDEWSLTLEHLHEANTLMIKQWHRNISEHTWILDGSEAHKWDPSSKKRVQNFCLYNLKFSQEQGFRIFTAQRHRSVIPVTKGDVFKPWKHDWSCYHHFLHVQFFIPFIMTLVTMTMSN